MHKIFNFSLFIILLSINNIALCFFNTDSPDLIKKTTEESFKTISETIIALDTTKEKIKSILQNSQNNTQNKNLQRNQSKTPINKKEINEYKVFINYLSIQINDYCTKIYHKYGSDALLSLPCENEITYSPLGKDNSSLTMNEQIESLDDELMKSLGTFDEMLLKEEEIIAMQTRKSQSSFESSSGQGSNSNGAADAEKSSDNNGSLDQQKSTNNKEIEDKENSKNKRASAKGKNQSGKNRNERRKLDKMDDDIVARQLKEAAEKEKDPALKKKLWDEYYKYKKKNNKS